MKHSIVHPEHQVIYALSPTVLLIVCPDLTLMKNEHCCEKYIVDGDEEPGERRQIPQLHHHRHKHQHHQHQHRHRGIRSRRHVTTDRENANTRQATEATSTLHKTVKRSLLPAFSKSTFQTSPPSTGTYYSTP